MRIPALAILLALTACKRSDAPAPAATGSESSAQAPKESAPAESTPAVQPPPVVLPEAKPEPPPPPAEPSPEDLAAQAEADQARKDRSTRIFGKVIVPLNKASEALQEHDKLADSSWFHKDKDDNQEEINELIDDAIGALGISEIENTRSAIRSLEQENVRLNEQLLKDREARLGAPSKDELNRLQNTYTTSREEIDARIAEALKTVEANRGAILEHQIDFVRRMRGIGVDLDLEAAQSLLSTVTGDDFVKLCVVFDNVRGITMQLQELTEQSGESLPAAKRYYGSYVVLIRILDHVQMEFVRRARQEMIPKLAVFSDKADELISEAFRNMQNGGDRAIGEQNVRANRLTIQATELYTEYLEQQAAEIEQRNQSLKIALHDAENTFETVVLSSEVAELLREGSRNFGALLQLDLPELRGFDNAELKAEFQRLTEKMSAIN
ncbi:MAG: hypothetical protein R3F33_02160 [Planctomycetota bacterium]